MVKLDLPLSRGFWTKMDYLFSFLIYAQEECIILLVSIQNQIKKICFNPILFFQIQSSITIQHFKKDFDQIQSPIQSKLSWISPVFLPHMIYMKKYFIFYSGQQLIMICCSTSLGFSKCEGYGLDWQSNPSTTIPQSLKDDLQSKSKSKIERILDFFNHPIQSFQP